MTSSSFSIHGSQYDLSTYYGRFKAFTNMVDPRMLFVQDSEVIESQILLSKFQDGCLSNKYSDNDLWRAKKIVDVAVNPGTGKIIPLPVRFAAFVPCNIPLVYGMLSSSSAGATLFWQWANQSYNSATNYANRSGTEISTSDIISS